MWLLFLSLLGISCSLSSRGSPVYPVHSEASLQAALKQVKEEIPVLAVVFMYRSSEIDERAEEKLHKRIGKALERTAKDKDFRGYVDFIRFDLDAEPNFASELASKLRIRGESFAPPMLVFYKNGHIRQVQALTADEKIRDFDNIVEEIFAGDIRQVQRVTQPQIRKVVRYYDYPSYYYDFGWPFYYGRHYPYYWRPHPGWHFVW